MTFAVGSLVKARGREWVVLPESDADLLVLLGSMRSAPYTLKGVLFDKGPWRPFLDPLNLHEYWWAFLLPLSLLISISYKAVRVRDLGFPYWRAVIIMTVQIILAMILLGAATFLLLEYILPAILPVRD